MEVVLTTTEYLEVYLPAPIRRIRQEAIEVKLLPFAIESNIPTFRNPENVKRAIDLWINFHGVQLNGLVRKQHFAEEIFRFDGMSARGHRLNPMQLRNLYRRLSIELRTGLELRPTYA
jgi:hypothetical protein